MTKIWCKKIICILQEYIKQPHKKKNEPKTQLVSESQSTIILRTNRTHYNIKHQNFRQVALYYLNNKNFTTYSCQFLLQNLQCMQYFQTFKLTLCQYLQSTQKRKAFEKRVYQQKTQCKIQTMAYKNQIKEQRFDNKFHPQTQLTTTQLFYQDIQPSSQWLFWVSIDQAQTLLPIKTNYKNLRAQEVWILGI
eukprot:TRINITY_DN16041_c0_g1_i1.p3 TRINITY_DN16041_c0_g1~~TRINITY_DN16041_c0_g1_i1.p3  ORF type:complete len:192 (+),score=-3.74 TRINITY_DN16041_c0_g1_i1:583-1158(+)